MEIDVYSGALTAIGIEFCCKNWICFASNRIVSFYIAKRALRSRVRDSIQTENNLEELLSE